MAITFVGSTKSNNRDDGATFTPTISAPTGLQEGDVVLLTSSADNANNVITLPDGTTELYNGDVDNSSVGPTRLAFGWLLIGATPPTEFVFTHSLDDAYGVSCVAFRNVDPATPLDVAISSATSDAPNPLPASPVINTLTPGCVILTLPSTARGPLFGEMDWENYYTPPAEVNKRVDAVDSAGSGFCGHAVGAETQASAGATTPRTWTCIENDVGGMVFTIALRPITDAAAFEPGQADIVATATGSLNLAKAHFTGSATATVTATASMGQAEPIEHIESVTGTSGGTGNITLAYPLGMMENDLSLVTITADNGALDVGLPAGYIEINPTPGPLMEEIIRKVAGQVSGDIDGKAYADKVYRGGARQGATYLSIPQLDGEQILWQDAAGTVPASADNDPILRLDDVSGNGLHAIQSTGSASMFLRYDGTNYWIDITNGHDRPIIPIAALTGDITTMVVGIDNTDSGKTVLMSAENNNAFMFASDSGSTSTTINYEVTFAGIRTDTVNGMEAWTPLPSDRGDNWDIYAASEIITFRGMEFTAVWTGDTGIKLLGYGYTTGWNPAGKFYGLAIVNEEAFTHGVDRGDGTLAFNSRVGYRILDGTEGNDETLTHDSGESAVATMSLFRYVYPNGGLLDAIPAVFEEGGLDGATTDDARTIPGLTTNTNGAWIIGIIANEQATTGHTPPAGVTEIVDLSTGTGNDGASVAIGYEALDEAGAYPSKDWTISTSTETPYRSYAIAIKPLHATIDQWPGEAVIEATATGQLVSSHRLAGDGEAEAFASGNLGVVTQYKGAAVAAATATASLGRKIPMTPAALEAVATSQGSLLLGVSLAGTALGEAITSGAIGSKIGLSGAANIVATAEGDMLRGSLGRGYLDIEATATGSLRPLTFVTGDASVEALASGAFRVKRALKSRVTGAATAAGALLPLVNLVGSASASAQVKGTILSFREVYFEGAVVIETFAVAQQAELLATFSEDVVAIGLATIIEDFGGTAVRRTIKLNPPDRTLNVGRRSGH